MHNFSMVLRLRGGSNQSYNIISNDNFIHIQLQNPPQRHREELEDLLKKMSTEIYASLSANGIVYSVEIEKQMHATFKIQAEQILNRRFIIIYDNFCLILEEILIFLLTILFNCIDYLMSLLLEDESLCKFFN